MNEALQPCEAPLIPKYLCTILRESSCVIWGKAAAFLPREACRDRVSKPDKIPRIQRKVNSRHLGVNVIGQELSNQMWFILSQNHRIAGVGRDLCGSSSPTLLPKQGHLQQAAQDLPQIMVVMTSSRERSEKHILPLGCRAGGHPKA